MSRGCASGPLAALLWAVTALGSALPAISSAAEPPPRLGPDDGAGGSVWTRDARGRRFRTGFDPGTRWELGGAWSGALGGEGPEQAGRVDLALRFRHRLDFPQDGVAWKLYHSTLSVRMLLDGAGPTSLQAVAYDGLYTRWSRDGWVMLPTSPPTRLAFPLNVGMRVRVGDIRLEQLPELHTVIEVLEPSVIFDFWRSRALGSYAQVGLGPAYGLRLGEGVLAHRVAPFTALSAALHHEWDSGRQWLDVHGRAAWRWSSQAGWGLEGSAALAYEVVVLAVNDLPVSLYAELEYGYGFDAPQPHRALASTGVRLGWPLR